jgi:membrane protease YdiL (CAAX protease family)
MPSLAPTSALLQCLFVALLLAATVYHDIVELPKLKRYTSSATRLAIYRHGVAGLWIMALLALALAGPHSLLRLPAPGGAVASLLGSPLMPGAAILALVLYFGAALAPALHCVARPLARAAYAKSMASLHFLLPVAARERRWWCALSISAGVCEEIVFRGFLPQFLQGQLHGGWSIDPALAWLLSVLAFGACHFYQGAAGMLRTALAGALFGLLALVSGDLLLPIVLHALVDIAVLLYYRPLDDAPQAAARLQQGCAPAQAYV